MSAILLFRPLTSTQTHKGANHPGEGGEKGKMCENAKARSTHEKQHSSHGPEHPTQPKSRKGWLERGNGGVREHCSRVIIHRSN